MSMGIAAVASLLSTSAFAADLAARPYAKAPVYVEPVYNWTGFYIGGNVGYSWGRSRDTATLTTAAGTVLFTDIASHNMDGVVGGGQIGYNWQLKTGCGASRPTSRAAASAAIMCSSVRPVSARRA
jgi:outer membrane immunogenic protein